MRKVVTLCLLLAATSCASVAATGTSGFGTFIGSVVARWLEDDAGRKMQLTEPFAYVAPDGTRWDAPKGSIVDGASIPRWAWAIVGSPFTGKYREASVIHDVACDSKTRPWQTVHMAFYTAMRASGVGEVEAKTMFAAVYHFGPRWPRVESKTVESAAARDQQYVFEAKARDDEHASVAVEAAGTTTAGQFSKVTAIYTPEEPKLSEQDFTQLKKAIEEKNLSLEQIESYRPTQ